MFNRLATKIVFPIFLLFLFLAVFFGWLFVRLIQLQQKISADTTRVQQLVDLTQQLGIIHHNIEADILVYGVKRKPATLASVSSNIDAISQTTAEIRSLVITPKAVELLDHFQQDKVHLITIERQLLAQVTKQGFDDVLFEQWLDQGKSVDASLKDLQTYNLSSLNRSQILLSTSLRELILTGFISGGLCVVVIAIFIIYLRSLITLPVKRLAMTARHIAEGNFEAIDDRYITNDELGQLATALNHMSHKLHAYYRHLKQDIEIKTKELLLREKLEKQKDDFIATASHELKTPITSQKAFLQLLQIKMQHNAHHEYLPLVDKINHQTNKLVRLISDLLDVSKITVGKFAINKEAIDLNRCIREAVEDVREIYRTHTIDIRGHVDQPVHADYYRITQVVSNLLLNAIKYSPDRPQVIVWIKKQADNITVTIQDFGIGIDRRFQKQVFNRFFRVSGQNEQTFSGMGIGLNLSAEIIKLHHGKIWCESELGKGSQFSFTLKVV